MTLGRLGYPCYLDTFDPSVAGDSPYLESYLRQVIGRCRALIAIGVNGGDIMDHCGGVIVYHLFDG